MNDLLIKALITVMIIDAGMHFYLLGFKPVQHSGVSQKRNGTLMNK